jgi:hypothetical protein
MKIVNERCPVRDRMSVEKMFRCTFRTNRRLYRRNALRLYETIMIKSLNFEIFKLKNCKS